MFKILSTALAFVLCVVSSTQASDKSSTKPYQDEPMQQMDNQRPSQQPRNSNMAPPSDDMTPPSGDMAPPSGDMAPPSGDMAPPSGDMAPPSKGKRPNKKPDQKPGGDRKPPELE